MIRSNLDDEQTPGGTPWSLLHTTRGPNDIFAGSKYHILSFKKQFLGMLFQFALSFTMLDLHVLVWAPL